MSGVGPEGELDRGLLLGDGIFETIPLHGGRPHGLDRHLARLDSGARALGLAVPPDLHEQVEAALARARAPAAPNPIPDGVLRLTLTAGSGPPGLLRPDPARSRLYIRVADFRPDPAWVARGLRALRAGRIHEGSLVSASGAKVTSYMERILALRAARAAGMDEALVSNAAGHLVEGSASALLWWDGSTLHLPSAGGGALPSLTVQLLAEALRAAPSEAPPIGSEPLTPVSLDALCGEGSASHPDAATGAGELLLASRLRQIVPVVEVEGRPVGAGRPGPIHSQLLHIYRERVRVDLAPAS